MDIIKRYIQKEIEQALFKGKILVIYGPRQAGKTTLIQEIQKRHPNDVVYLNCDEPDIRAAFTNATSTAMLAFIGNKRLVFFDEAQRVENIGLSLKLLHDTNPNLQIVATGSSSFELANKINEPLTGRKHEFFLPPISIHEFSDAYGQLEAIRTIEQRMIFGMYPEVIIGGAAQAKQTLIEITSSYLYKDILAHQRIGHPEVLEKLLRALALQIGQEVSYTELAQTVGVTKQTVERYVELLEKTFVIFRVPPLYRNRRKEISKLRKIYFFDTGVRNILLNSLNDLSLRQDTGALWENFLMSERYKITSGSQELVNRYFWRTYDQREIDYVEEKNGVLHGYEFKWKTASYRPPKAFLDLYSNTPVTLITKENFVSFCRND